RIPKRVDSTRPAAMRLAQPFDNPVELAFLLERRIDEDEPSLFLRREMCAESQPAIELHHPGLEITMEKRLKPVRIFRMEFNGGEAILAPKEMARQQRRTGIAFDRSFSIDRPDGVQIWREARCDGRRQGRPHKPPDASPPLTGFLRLGRRQVVQTDSGMRIEDPKGLVLEFQILNQAGDHHMLDDIREIAGVIGMAIVHAPLPQRGGRGCEPGLAGFPPALARKVKARPIKPIAASEKPIGWSRASTDAPCERTRSTACSMTPSASPLSKVKI